MSSLLASDEDLEAVCRRIRGRLVSMSHRAGTPHLASALSCVEILVALYWRVARVDPVRAHDELRDRCILSKGHAATALYAVLAQRGSFPDAMLDTFAEEGAPLAEQPSPGCAPGVEVATGSLGHGLPVGLGMALAARILRADYRVFVVMSDGECNEGSVWEAAMFAAAQRVDRLAVIIDYNKWQATGRSNEIMALSPLREKWLAFNWNAYEVDGHSIDALVQALSKIDDAPGRPLAIVAHTVKAKGISFMEDDNNWHYRVPTADEVTAAHQELGLT